MERGKMCIHRCVHFLSILKAGHWPSQERACHSLLNAMLNYRSPISVTKAKTPEQGSVQSYRLYCVFALIREYLGQLIHFSMWLWCQVQELQELKQTFDMIVTRKYIYIFFLLRHNYLYLSCQEKVYIYVPTTQLTVYLQLMEKDDILRAVHQP